jgi:hypothetical protein
MSVEQQLRQLASRFLSEYDADAANETWLRMTSLFRDFFERRILASDQAEIPDDECDEIIRILDRNGKGNRKNSEAVAKAMIPQNAWRRMLNEFHANRTLGQLVEQILKEADPVQKAGLIDRLYAVNKGNRNYLTGASGNAIGALLAAYDPVNNVSVISLNDRRAILDFLVPREKQLGWNDETHGERIVWSNSTILESVRAFGLLGNARTVTRFFYWPPVKELWKNEHTVNIADRNISVTVPTVPDDEEDDVADSESVRESMQIQGVIARIGTQMGFKIWLPRADRGRVLRVWTPEPGELIDQLPLGYDATTTKTIEQIDVLWLRRRSIVRAFEVEHTTSVYSGLLRMADLVALQPDLNIKLHIVAPSEKRGKVLQEIRRPVFSLLEGRALSEMCTYLSYDDVRDLGEQRHLEHLSDRVLDTYAESAIESDLSDDA